MADPLSDEAIARRDDLLRVTEVLGLLLSPVPLATARHIQGLAYAELLGEPFRFDHKELAKRVGVGGKALDWSANKAKASPRPPADPVTALKELLAPAMALLGAAAP